MHNGTVQFFAVAKENKDSTEQHCRPPKHSMGDFNFPLKPSFKLGFKLQSKT